MGYIITLGILSLLAILPLGVSVRYNEEGPLVKVLAGPFGIRLLPGKKKENPKKQARKDGKRREKQAQVKQRPTRGEEEADERSARGGAEVNDRSAGGGEEADERWTRGEEEVDERSAQAEKKPSTPEKLEKLPQPPQPPKPSESAQKVQKGGSVTDFLPLVKVGLNLLGDFRRKLRVNRLEVRLILAGEDPGDLAINYGRVWAAVGNLMPRLEQYLVIKKRDIDIQCDFTAEKTLVSARLDATISLGRLLSLGGVYGVRALKEFLKIKKKRKGGAENE